jgi:hypothetical protein
VSVGTRARSATRFSANRSYDYQILASADQARESGFTASVSGNPQMARAVGDLNKLTADMD